MIVVVIRVVCLKEHVVLIITIVKLMFQLHLQKITVEVSQTVIYVIHVQIHVDNVNLTTIY